jgi:hypothetical protein
VVIKVATARFVMGGWALAVLGSVIMVSIMAYHAFIFRHVLSIGAQMGSNSQSLNLGSRPAKDDSTS